MTQKAEGWMEQLFRNDKTIDWDFYFSTSVRFHLNKVSEAAIFEMNKILIQRGVIIPRDKGGKFGIINDSHDICQSSALNGIWGCGLYFRFRSDAFNYLAAAQKHGFFKKDAFIFQICATNGKKEDSHES